MVYFENLEYFITAFRESIVKLDDISESFEKCTFQYHQALNYRGEIYHGNCPDLFHGKCRRTLYQEAKGRPVTLQWAAKSIVSDIGAVGLIKIFNSVMCLSLFALPIPPPGIPWVQLRGLGQSLDAVPVPRLNISSDFRFQNPDEGFWDF